MSGKPYTVTVFASAKINLCLHVTGQHENGYHLLDTLVAFADVGDQLTLRTAGSKVITVIGPEADQVPDTNDNILMQVALDFWKPDIKLSMELQKNLPVASGIGGGSADAAAGYRGMLYLRSVVQDDLTSNLPQDDHIRTLFRIGADVPMCVLSEPARVGGFGEQIVPIANFPTLYAVLVNPRVPVSTPQVFKALTQKQNPPLTPLPDLLTAETLIEWLRGQRNDLEMPAIAAAPQVSQVLEALGRAAGCQLARMSGSGATCFGLFADRAAADQAAERIVAEQPDWWVKASTLNGQNFVAPQRL